MFAHLLICSCVDVRFGSLAVSLTSPRHVRLCVELEFGDLACLQQAVIEVGWLLGNGEDQGWLSLRLRQSL